MTDLLDSIDWQRQHNRLNRFFVTMTRDPHIAEELTQEVLSLAWEIRHRFDPHRGHSSELNDNFGAWIKGIARKRLKSHYSNCARSTKRVGDFDFDSLEIPFLDPLDSLAIEDLSCAIRTALAACNCEERATFRLLLSGKSTKDIQRTLRIAKPNTVHKRISRCMARLKRKLDQLNVDDQLLQVVFQSSVEFVGRIHSDLYQVLQNNEVEHGAIGQPERPQATSVNQPSQSTLRLIQHTKTLIEQMPGGLLGSLRPNDAAYANEQLDALTFELGQENPSVATIRRLLGRLREMLPSVADEFKRLIEFTS